MPDFFSVGKVNAVLVPADPSNQKKVTNSFGGKLYFKNASDVSTSSTEIAVGSSKTFEENLWFISESESKVTVERERGIATAQAVPGYYAGAWAPTAATSGTDTTPAEKKLFVTSLFLPFNKKIKGIGYLVGSVGGTNKAVLGLWDKSGALLAKTTETTEGTLVGTAAEMQQVDLTSEFSAVGPAVYFVGITMNGNTARLRSIPKNTAGSNIFSEEITISEKNKLANITAPTAFKEDKGPVAWVY